MILLLLTTVVDALNQRDALMALYMSTNGSNWASSKNWSSSEPLCRWEGVDCQNDVIIGLSLWQYKLQGPLPAELFLGIPTLKSIGLGTNKITEVPEELFTHPALEEVWLLENEVQGNLEDYCRIKQAKTLGLASNRFNGTIPACFGNIPSLVHLYLDHNSLSGPIPPELGRLSSLKLLILDHTELTGSIPVALGSLSDLFILKLSNTPMNGSIPQEVMELPSLKILDLSNCSFSGTLPMVRWGGKNITDLNIDRNQLEGELTPLLSLSSLASLKASKNRFSGDPTTVIRDLKSIVVFDASDNAFIFESDISIQHQSLLLLDLSNSQMDNQIVQLDFPTFHHRFGMALMTGNDFHCPYPLVPPHFTFDHDPCSVPPRTWARVGVALGAIGMAFGPLLFALSIDKRIQENMRVVRAFTRIVRVILNIIVLASMVRFLSTAETPTCNVLNDREVFIRFMPWRLLYSDFENPINGTTWQQYYIYMWQVSPRIRNDNFAEFTRICQSFDHCEYAEYNGCQSHYEQIYPRDQFQLRKVAIGMLILIIGCEILKVGLVWYILKKPPHTAPIAWVLSLSSCAICVALAILWKSKTSRFFETFKTLTLSKRQLTIQFVQTLLLESLPLMALSVTYTLYTARSGLAWESYLGMATNLLSVAYFIERFLTSREEIRRTIIGASSSSTTNTSTATSAPLLENSHSSDDLYSDHSQDLKMKELSRKD